MAVFQITVDDPGRLAGLTYVRTLWNLSNPNAQYVDDAAYLQGEIDRRLDDYKKAVSITITVDDPVVVAQLKEDAGLAAVSVEDFVKDKIAGKK